MSEYLPELRSLIKTDRAQEAKTLLETLGSRPESDQKTVIEILALASDRTAFDLIGFLMAAPDLDNQTRQQLFQLATDRAHLQFEFSRLLLAHGTPDQVRQIIPLLKHILARATQGDLLNLILRQAGKLRLKELTDDVAEFIFYNDDNLKREAVKALERMGSRTALNHLEHIATTDKCDTDILDALDMLKGTLGTDTGAAPQTVQAERRQLNTAQEDPPQDLGDLDPMLEKLASPRLDQRIEAFRWFTDHPELVAVGLHRSLETDSHDLLVNLLRLTARTIPHQAMADLLTLATRDDMEASLRFALLTTLAAFPELESAAAVLSMIESPSSSVRLAAVKVLDRNCSDYIAAEVKARIETGTKKGEALGITILDAGARNLINALMNSDTFTYIAGNYLERSAPASAIDAYIEVMEKRNRTSTVKKYSRIRLERTREKRPFFVAIHPTRAYLDVYTKLIHDCGYETRCFSAPQEAFESIVFEKPAGVICDLFIRQLSVLELAGEIRELYPETEVPIIVSTLQRDLDKALTKKEFQARGINALCGFPAKPSQIKSWAQGK